ncbi:MAG: nucleoside 2-deoxyribosyltransferase [archaeon]|nr:MAG: nucleoside 2-deoxyribosyltransferase [archaeon]
MKAVLLFRWYGEDRDKVMENLDKMEEILREIGHEVYHATKEIRSPDHQPFTQWKMLCRVFEEIDESDVIIPIIKSDDISEGMLIEIGYAHAKSKKIVLLIKKGLKHRYLKEAADQTIEFKDFDDLLNKLKELK